MMEKILRIEEASFKKNPPDWEDFEGYQVVTDKQTIKLGISSGSHCCETFGVFVTNDDTSDFIGAKIIKIIVVDECLKAEKAPDIYEGGIMFINIETTKGVLQFTAYNEHNGYYGHTGIVISNQLITEQTL